MKLELLLEDGTSMTVEGVVSFKEINEQIVNPEIHAYEVAQTPTEGKLFEIIPLQMDRSLFKEERKEWQEVIRKIILEAFVEVDKNSAKYATPFYTLIPEKDWVGCKTVDELKQYAHDLGGDMADWVEQALEWAQRISNGESWEDICNNPDTAKWCRLIVWKKGYCRLIGDWQNSRNSYPATDIGNGCDSNDRLFYTVPLVSIRKKRHCQLIFA